MLDNMYETMSISSGLYSKLDLWNANKLQLQLQLQDIKYYEPKEVDTISLLDCRIRSNTNQTFVIFLTFL